MIRLSVPNSPKPLTANRGLLLCVQLLPYRANVLAYAMNRKRDIEENADCYQKIVVFDHADILRPTSMNPLGRLKHSLKATKTAFGDCLGKVWDLT